MGNGVPMQFGVQNKPIDSKLGYQRVKKGKKTILVWHATNKANLKALSGKYNFKRSPTGRLGPAAYFAMRKQDAYTIAKSAWAGGNGIVVTAEMKTDGVIYNAGLGDKAKRGEWVWPISCVKATHPAWANAGLPKPFTEVAVHNSKRRIRILCIKDAKGKMLWHRPTTKRRNVVKGKHAKKNKRK